MAIFLGIVFILVCILLILIVLLQKGRGGGLGAALGGGGGNTAFGTKTGDVFTLITIILTGLFLLVAVLASFAFRAGEGAIAQPAVRYEGRDYTSGDIEVAQGGTIELLRLPGSTIRYEFDGGEVTERSKDVQGAGINIDFRGQNSRTLAIQAYRPGYQPSKVVTYTLKKALPAAAAVRFDPDETGLLEPTEVKLTSATRGATIRYTTDGADPMEESPLYTEPVMVNPGTTIKARAFADEHKPSVLAVAIYQRKIAKLTATPMPPETGIADPVEVQITTPTEGAKIYYTLDGKEPTANSTLYSEPVKVAPGTTLRARAFGNEQLAPSDELKVEYKKAEGVGFAVPVQVRHAA